VSQQATIEARPGQLETAFGRIRPLVLAAALGAGAVLIVALLFLWQQSVTSQALAISKERSAQLQQLVQSTSGEQSLLLSEGASAEERNALIPVMNGALEHPRAFRSIRAGTPAYEAALKCLTQAIYYEAAKEPLAGRRAVAQVVLNRVAHPAYPNSVCGVVYQGADQPVCQFSFTCDGSLLRKPLPSLWQSARNIAEAALSGYVEDSVGSATHYHADYVLPRWAYKLGKIEQLGHHIFYRFRGNAGGASFLTARWSGHEAIPALDYDRLRRELAGHNAIDPAEEFVGGLTVAPSVTDRHAENDVGGRIDVTKEWRLTIPDPVAASEGYRQTLADQGLGGGSAAREDGPTT